MGAEAVKPVKSAEGLYQSNFLFGVLAMPAEARRAVKAVYDFCRVADDDTDLAPDAAAERIKAWRGELDACYRGIPSRPVTRALLPFIRRHQLKREYFDRLLDGMDMDARKTRYQTIDELAAYCECVAGAVGLLTLQALGLHEDERAREYSRNLSMGLQLTNILRDLAEDYARGRVYIPAEDFASADYTEAQLGERKINKSYFVLCRYEIARIRTYFRKAEKVSDQGLRRALVCPEIMRATYEELLRRMEKSLDNLAFGEKPTLSLFDRAMVAVMTYLEIKIGR